MGSFFCLGTFCFLNICFNPMIMTKVLLGVCGSIAAYKSALLVRLLVKEGFEVRVVMTQDAAEFITPLTLSTLSKNAVVSSFTNGEGAMWNNHVELGLWADLMLIAPASANTLAKMANGICDNVLLATYLSAKCPVFFAPAMDLDMWKHASTQRNIATLQSYGNTMIDVEDGELASGLVGKGRMAEPESILDFVREQAIGAQGVQSFKGKKVLLTAGPTYEPIDPVRFIGNRSSGKMGIAIAEAAYARGAEVSIVLGPTNQRPRYAGIEVISVTTAEQMFQETTSRFDKADLGILTAAVADFTPASVSDQKIKKKSGQGMSLELGRTKDILRYLGEHKNAGQMLVGFALETQNGIENAQKKLIKKNLDFIVLNSLADKGAGFQHDTNKITILDRHNNIRKFELKSKRMVASDILDQVELMWSQKDLE